MTEKTEMAVLETEMSTEEREAVAEMAREAALYTSVKNRAKRRYWRLQGCLIILVAVSLAMFTFYDTVVGQIVKLATGCTIQLLVPSWRPGLVVLAGVLVGFGVRIYIGTERYQEIGKYRQIGRARLSYEVLAVLLLMLATWVMLLVCVYAAGDVPAIFHAVMMFYGATTFLYGLIGYLFIVFLMELVDVSWRQVLEQEKIAAGL